MATVTYKFKIGNDNISYSEKTTVKIANVDYKLSLLSLRYHKKMFQPGKIECKLQVSSLDGKIPSKDDVVSHFKTKQNNVMLSKTVDNVEKKIAENYYVYKVMPEYKRKEGKQILQVRLDIYSPDHKLTLDKYCRTYTNQKLIEDILKGELKTDGILKNAGFTNQTFDGSKSHFLNYIYSISSTKDDTTGIITETIATREFLQPYLVQFNESFYDFIARTANRCGEFFFYEDGKLYLGIDDQEATDTTKFKSRIDIDKDKVLSFSYEEADDSLVEVARIRHDSMSKDKTYKGELYGSANYMQTENVSYDDYLDDFFKEDQFTTFNDEWFPMGLKTAPQAVATLLNGGLEGAVKFIAGTLLYQLVFAKSYASRKNKILNKKWVLESDQGTGKQRHAGEQYDSSQKTAVLTGTLQTEDVKKHNWDYQVNLNQKFFNFISQGCREVGRHMVSVSLGTQQLPFKLGQKVTFESASEVDDQIKKKEKEPGATAFNFPRYLITEVTEVIKNEIQEGVAPSEDWMLGQKVVLLPQYTVTTKKFNSAKEEKRAISCPPVMVPFVRTAGAQRAYVADTKDPNGYGRICIRYPWQKKDDASSPWIRVAVPYAPNTSTHGGGVYFQHREGDEVLVDYEEGNIEHPLVVGSLYTSRAKAPSSGAAFHTWDPINCSAEPVDLMQIVSHKGHKIVFDDNGNSEDFMRSVLPPLDMIKYATNPLKSWRPDQDMTQAWSGGIKLTDNWGVYKINCSTTERKITIDSPFGSVAMNAFTGISINAPFGNVSIKGKNVTIEAGNELKLLSGTNIKNKLSRETPRELLKIGTVNTLIDKTAARLVDLTLARCVVEILVKPVAGTMTLKSLRYMLIMAGKGSAEIPNKAFTYKGVVQKEDVDGISFTGHDSINPLKWEILSDHVVMANTLRFINKQVDDYYDNNILRSDIIVDLATQIANEGALQDGDTPAKVIEYGFLQKDHITEMMTDDNYIQFSNNVGDEKKAAIAHNVILLTEYCNVFLEDFNEPMCNKLPEESKFQYYKKVKELMGASNFDEFANNIRTGHNPNYDDIKKDALKNHVKALKRKLAYDLIEDTCVVEQVPDDKDPDKYIKFQSLNDCLDDMKWNKYVSRIKNYTGQSAMGLTGALKRFGLEGLNYLKNKVDDSFAFYKMYRETGIWGSEQNGEILFSDKNGSETLNFVNGGLSHRPNEDAYDVAIRKELLAFC